MAIHLKCPNAACGQMLNIRDDYAGRNGKCPACGAIIAVPAKAVKETLSNKRTPVPQPKEESAEPPGPVPEPAPAPEAATEKAGPEPPPPTALPEPVLEPLHIEADGFTATGLAIGICALVLLSFSTQMGWVFISGERRSDIFSPRAQTAASDGFTLMISMTVAPHFLFYSAGTAVLALIALTLTQLLSREQADAVIVAAGSLAVGWGVAAGMWLLAYLWKVFTQWSNAPSGITILPSIGLLLGLFSALTVVIVFGYLIASRRKLAWLFTAGGMGFLLGLFLLLFNAKPWHSWSVML